MYITNLLEISEEINNPVCKVTTDKLQPVLSTCNVLIRSIFDTKVLQGNVAMRLGGDGIFILFLFYEIVHKVHNKNKRKK